MGKSAQTNVLKKILKQLNTVFICIPFRISRIIKWRGMNIYEQKENKHKLINCWQRASS